MKVFLALCLLLLPASLYAQNQGGMNQGNMQDMMKVMQQVQECMAQIDQNQLNELQARAEKFKQDIDGLCAKGERDDAQNKAMAFAKKMAADPALQQMKKCGEMAQGAVPMMGITETFDEKKYADRHVCDE